MFGQNDGEMQQARAWQAHNAGDVALITSRSPYSFMTGYAHELFADGRANLVSRAWSVYGPPTNLDRQCPISDEESDASSPNQNGKQYHGSNKKRPPETTS
jgi:hypothetical protein